MPLTETERVALVRSIEQARDRVDQLEDLLNKARAVRDQRMLDGWRRGLLPSVAARAGGIGYQRLVNIKARAEREP